MEGFDRQAFRAPVGAAWRTFDVYSRGEGPPVLILQELPGIGPQVLAFADRLVTAGFQVWLPHFFGPLGRIAPLSNLARVFCMRREFQMFASDRSSAIVEWLRALCRHVAAETGVKGVGVIGMCLTGGFALALIAEDAVAAAVAAQPSLPAKHTRLHMSAREIAASRAALDAKGPMPAFRFEDDTLCTAARFAAIDAAFNADGRRVDLKVLPGAGHSVFTVNYDDSEGPTRTALSDLLDYLTARLRAPMAS